MRFLEAVVPVLAILAVAAGGAHSQECKPPDAAQFKRVTVFQGMTNPSQFAVLPDGRIFAVEQWTGRIWSYTPGQAAKAIGTVPTNPGRKVEDGGLGILADLDFAKTGWIYVYHTPMALGSTRIERWTVRNDQLSNPKIILEAPRDITPGKVEDQRHAGGGMAWNRKTGDLFLAVGDDTYPFGDRSVYGPRDPDKDWVSGLKKSGNTNDLRGKLLRIRPIPFPDSETSAPGVGKTYAIPEGNLFPPGRFPAGKTRPEIYAMGFRNAYRVKVDTLTGWAYVGEVGADADAYNPQKGPPGFDRLNLVRSASNFGWPFTNGYLEPYKVRDYETLYLQAGYKVGDDFDLKNLKNLSPFNTGLVDLPPAVAPLVYYSAAGLQKGVSAELGPGRETIIAGPVYHYNPRLASPGKLPPWFHRKVIFGDYSRNFLYAATVGTDGGLKDLDRIGDVHPIDMDIGPDGTLYVLEYGGRLFSMQYTGTQYSHTACPDIRMGCMDPRFKEFDQAATLNDPAACKTSQPLSVLRARARLVGGTRLVTALNGRMPVLEIPERAEVVEVYGLGGSLIWRTRVQGTRLALPAGFAGRGILHARFTAD